ncbi:MAG: helix-hairpin-helix domain-containing protein [Clostridia bacterium]
MGEKSAQNIINSLEKSKKNQLSRLIYALGIRHIGEKTARSLAEKFLDIDAIMAADFDTLCSIDDIGAESANSIINFFSVDANKKTIERLKNAQVNMSEIIIQKGTAFEGKIVVVTGTLPTLKRDEAEEMIAKNGGKASSSVSKKTSFVLAGEGAGSKLTKAKELGIVILDESDFLKMIKNSKK